jgi:hypothetical protein
MLELGTHSACSTWSLQLLGESKVASHDSWQTCGIDVQNLLGSCLGKRTLYHLHLSELMMVQLW